MNLRPGSRKPLAGTCLVAVGPARIVSRVPSLLVLAALLAPGIALAADPAAPLSQQDRDTRAAALCKSGDYGGGVKLLEELHRETRKPVLIRNQGRCFEDNGRLVPAINRFKAYLATGDIAHKDDVERRLVTVEQRANFEGEKACLAGDYQTGVQRFAELHAELGKPSYLHAQARCYDQNRQYERAVNAFRDYLRVADLSAEERGLIHARIQYLDAFLADGRAKPAAPAAGIAAARGAPSGVPEQPGKGSPSLAMSRPAAVSPVAGPAWRRPVAIAALGVGAASVVAGVVFGVIARNNESDIEAASQKAEFFDTGLYDSGRRAAKIATVTLIAGPVLIASGLGLYLWSRAEPGANPSAVARLELAPILDADGGGAALSFRY